MKRKAIIILLLISIAAMVCVGCAAAHVCDKCGKTFSGTAYYDAFDYDTTWCAKCATKYYAPFPINNWAKK
ncbi:MAG: hypothetical protein HPY50_01440 [Firmicutes bacterium]|nr:hypothetical protein [Bacillota bacterium]